MTLVIARYLNKKSKKSYIFFANYKKKAILSNLGDIYRTSCKYRNTKDHLQSVVVLWMY